MAHDVFVSYSSHDKPVGDAVCAALESKAVRCWIAPRDIVPGQDWGNSIVEAISAARVMVLVFSRSANSSPHIKREVERAVHRGLVIIPFRIDDVLPEASLEYFLGTPHWLDALTPPLEAHLERLAEVVSSFLGGATSQEPARPKALIATRSKRRRRFAATGTAALAAAAVAIILLARGGGAPPRSISQTSAPVVKTVPTTNTTALTAASTATSSTLLSTTSTLLSTTGSTALASSTTAAGYGAATTTLGVPLKQPAVAGSWVVREPLEDMADWSLDLGSNGRYKETVTFSSHGSAQWRGHVVPSQPFAHLVGPIQVLLISTSSSESEATFTPVSASEVDAGSIAPYGFAAFIQDESGVYISNQSIPGTVPNDHEWRADLNVGGVQWAMDFIATGPGYTFTATHSESGKWTATTKQIQLVPGSGAETVLQYSPASATTMSVTTPGHEMVQFVRTS